jgi:glycosyltransferase involved in cell wall biosynthesis
MKKQKYTIPSLSIVVPLHNEGDFVVSQMKKLYKQLRQSPSKNYEIILAENGSSDDTYQKCKALAKKYKYIRVITSDSANKGVAMQQAFLKAKKQLIVQFDLDLIDISFVKKILRFYNGYDFFIGSKSLGKDERPFARKLMSTIFGLLLQIIFKYKGTDTHGVLGFKRSALLSIIKELPVTPLYYDTSILLAAADMGYHIKELPIRVKEMRPTRFALFTRVLHTIIDLFYLILIKHAGWKKPVIGFNIENKAKFTRYEKRLMNLKFHLPFL